LSRISFGGYGKILFKFLLSGDIKEVYKRAFINTSFELYCRALRELIDKPLISFVIPTCNEASYIFRLLGSLSYIKSICKIPVEIIVADYQSSDGTIEIAKRFGAEVIELDKPGVGQALYIATVHAQGDIIIRTDADVIITPSSIYYALSTLMGKTKVMTTVGHIYYPFRLETNIMAFIYDKYMRKPYNTTGYFIAFKKQLTKYVNFSPNLKYDEDWDFGYRVYKLYKEGYIHYNYMVAVLVSSRLIDKLGFARYITRQLIKAPIITYTERREDENIIRVP
jgi:glycosyltransferase involved in cell wall biosynthesis